MKEKVPVVRCVYNEAGKTLEEAAKEAFRLYLARVLSGEGTNAADRSEPCQLR